MEREEGREEGAKEIRREREGGNETCSESVFFSSFVVREPPST